MVVKMVGKFSLDHSDQNGLINIERIRTLYSSLI